jgi:uncharacterized protein
MLTFLYALTLGFIGSFHCIGMCGPIALTLPVQHLDGVRRQMGILLYNAGRITTYSLIGGVSGWVGRQFVLSGFQQWLSIILGVTMLLILALQYLPKRKHHLPADIYRHIRNILGRLLQRRQLHTLYAIGFFNGMLPCGLIYFALTGAVAAAHPIQGALFMAAFGAGTLPAMIAISWCSHLISVTLRSHLRKCVPVVVGIMAILLIIRGWNVVSAHREIIHCHKSF